MKGKSLSGIKPYSDNESIDSLIKRFNKMVEKEGIIREYKKREFNEKPSEKRRKKRPQKQVKIKTRQLKDTKIPFLLLIRLTCP
ncbi:MAG: 30S ribosomal protein S21 [Deltaproteobacteria bacterium]|nr:30S ribosomal protein S21 [Deltaproteobacteria bacterium]